MAGKKKAIPRPDTVITLTLPGEGGIQRTGTLVMKRGDLATIRQFDYCNVADIATAIQAATAGMVDLQTLKLPDIKTTEADVYKPDLEAKRKQLVEGVTVKLKDGREGEIVPVEAAAYDVPIHSDSVIVCVAGEDGLLVRCPIAEVVIVPSKPTAESSVDPLTVKADVPPLRPATDVSPMGESPEQLTMF